MCRRGAWVVSWFRCCPRLSDVCYSTRIQTKLASPSWRPIRRIYPPFTPFMEQDGTGLVVDMQSPGYILPKFGSAYFFQYMSFFWPLLAPRLLVLPCTCVYVINRPCFPPIVRSETRTLMTGESVIKHGREHTSGRGLWTYADLMPIEGTYLPSASSSSIATSRSSGSRHVWSPPQSEQARPCRVPASVPSLDRRKRR